jgi:hypothetical protein
MQLPCEVAEQAGPGRRALRAGRFRLEPFALEVRPFDEAGIGGPGTGADFEFFARAAARKGIGQTKRSHA